MKEIPSIDYVASIIESACQPQITRKLAPIVLRALQGEMPIPPVFFSGFAGLGKTRLAVELLFEQILEPEGWTLCTVPVECTGSKFNHAIVQAMIKAGGGPVMVWMDELHSLSAGAMNFLKVISELPPGGKTFKLQCNGEETAIFFDPRRIFYVAASNESVGDSALVGQSGRFTECQFIPYDENGKATVFRALLGSYAGKKIAETIQGETEEMALRNVRPFGRTIKNLCIDLAGAASWGCNLGTVKGMREALKKAEYYPGGWTKRHIDVLKFIASDKKGKQNQEISGGPLAGADKNTTRAILDELMADRLIGTAGNGRKQHTTRAFDLLESLKKKKKVAIEIPDNAPPAELVTVID